MHILHSLFSVPVELYSATRCIFACQGELPNECLPPLVELLVESFAMHRVVRAVPRADHVIHMGGVSRPIGSLFLAIGRGGS